MTKKLLTRQVCFILLCFGSSLRTILYPTNLSYFVGNSGWVCAAINYGVSAVFVCLCAIACSRSDKTFFERIEATCGKVCARIIYALLGVYFLLISIAPVCEHQLYVLNIFYDTIPSLLIFLPFFFFSVFMAGKSIRVTGRLADLCLPIFIFCAITLIFFSLQECDFGSLLPIFKVSPKEGFEGITSNLYRFNEGAVMLIFMGNFKYKKGDWAKISISYLIGGLIIIAFVGAYYGVYTYLTPDMQFATSKIGLFFSAIGVIGRIDYIFIYALEIVQLIALVFNIQLSVYALTKTFNTKNSKLISLCLNVFLLLAVILLNHRFTALQGVYAKIGYIITLIFAGALPTLSLFLRRDNEHV